MPGDLVGLIGLHRGMSLLLHDGRLQVCGDGEVLHDAALPCDGIDWGAHPVQDPTTLTRSEQSHLERYMEARRSVAQMLESGQEYRILLGGERPREGKNVEIVRVFYVNGFHA